MLSIKGSNYKIIQRLTLLLVLLRLGAIKLILLIKIITSKFFLASLNAFYRFNLDSLAILDIILGLFTRKRKALVLLAIV